MSFKDQGGVGQLPWWIGSQPQYDSFGQLKCLNGETGHGDDQLLVASPQTHHQALAGKKNAPIVINPSIFSGLDPGKGLKFQELSPPISLQPALPAYQGGFELGLGNPMACPNYSYAEQCYGMYAAAYRGQPMHGRMLLPSIMTSDEPVYVNAKQFHGILRRRQARAKAKRENKLTKVRRPYLHESRHLHAMRRARGSSGRFLNTKTSGSCSKEKDGVPLPLPRPAASPSSEVLETDSDNPNSGRGGGGGSNMSGSEVTSMYTIQHQHSSFFHPLMNLMDVQRSARVSGKWVAAADGCYDLLKV